MRTATDMFGGERHPPGVEYGIDDSGRLPGLTDRFGRRSPEADERLAAGGVEDATGRPIAGRAMRPLRRLRFTGEQPLPVRRPGHHEQQICALAVGDEVGLPAQHPSVGPMLGRHIGGLHEPGDRGRDRAGGDPGQPALTGPPITTAQQGMPREHDGRQQRRRAQHSPGLLQSDGEFGEGVTPTAVLLRQSKPVHPDLTGEPRPERLVVPARSFHLLAQFFGPTGLGEQVP